MSPYSTDEVTSVDVPGRFPGKAFSRIRKFDGLVDGTPVFFRQSGFKPQGWQITIRVREPFGQAVTAGSGFLCVNRGKCYMIPHEAIRAWLGGKLVKQTVDIFVDFEREVIRSAGLHPLAIDQFAGL